MAVKHTHAEYDRLSPLWKRCRDAVAGQKAIHEAGKAYLPVLKGEEDEDYKARLCRSDFFNATFRTTSALTGMAFAKPPVVKLPAAIEKWKDDIDLAGVNLDALAEQVVEEVLEVGRVGILVDHPPAAATPISQAAAEAQGLRPSIQLYPAESIRNWKHGRVGNRVVLTMVVLGETEMVATDEFESKAEDRFRVLDLDEAGHYRQRLFKVENGKDVQIGADIYPLMNGKPLTFIPFLIVGRSGKGDKPDEPPLIDLVDANIAHYQVNADYRHGLHFTGLPTLFLAGVVQEVNAAPFYIGGQAAITSQHPDAKGMFIEYTGQGLNAVKDALASLERRMAILGARMIADESKQAETLGATQIKRAGENSVLARIVITASEAIEAALGIMAMWAGAGGEIVYQINRDFAPAMLGAQELTALVAAWQNGALSEAELFEVLQRGDVIDAAKPFDEHQAEAEAQVVVPKPAPAANDQVAA